MNVTDTHGFYKWLQERSEKARKTEDARIQLDIPVHVEESTERVIKDDENRGVIILEMY